MKTFKLSAPALCSASCWLPAGRFSHLVLVLILSLSVKANALVNMKDASFVGAWSDAGLTRVYNSRSLTRSIIGFGWCFTVQTHLAMVDARTIELIGCMNQTHLIYKKDDDGFYRRKTFSSKVGPVQNLDDFITYRNGIYFRQTGMDAIEKFDSQGRLLFMDDAKGATVTVEYDFKGRISQIKRSDGSRLQFTYSVATALGPEFLTKLTTINPHAPPPMRTKILNYRYRQDDLVSVADERKVETRFTYDTFHNLIDVHYPDQTSEHISYDTEKDQVTAIKERDGCLNQLTVEPALQRPLQTYRTRLRKTCAGRVVANTAFEFALSQSQSGTRLVKLRIHSAKSAAEINFETKSSAYSQIASQPVTLKKEK